MVLMERYVIMNRKLKPGAAHHHSKSQDSFETLIKCAFLCLPLCEIRGVIKDEASTPHFCLYQQSVFKWIIYQDLVAERRALALLICGSSTGEAGDLKGNYWYVLCVCVCVQAVGGRRDHGAPAGHVHRSGLHSDLQHWASSSAAVPVRSLQKIQQHPFPQLQALLLCYTDGESVCLCLYYRVDFSSGQIMESPTVSVIMS